MGWQLADSAATADAMIVGPGVLPDDVQQVVRVERAQGIDGFRWGIRHLAFTREWAVETVPYGLIADQVIDVRRPKKRRKGVMVLLHGGFWMQAWQRSLMDGIAVDLTRRGYETWNIEYGRVGGSGGWPQTGEDVLAAMDAVVVAAETETATVVGHSAGAQLALWAAARRPEAVERVVSLAGLCDLDTARQQRLGGGAVERLLEGRPAAVASPLDQVPLHVPVLLAHCADDQVVPPEQSETFAHAAAAAGDEVEVLRHDRGGHMSLIEPEGAWQTVANRL